MAAPTDVIVIGAGVIGCAVAFELARRGASVQVVDDRPAGMGATQASAGVLAPYIEAADGTPLLELTARSLDLFDAFIARVASVTGADVEYRRSGTIDVATEDQTMERFRGMARALAQRNVEAELLDRAGIRAREPHLSEEVRGGLWIPSHGYVAAGALTRALVTAARRHGAQVNEHGRVRRIEQAGDDLVVETDRGRLAAGAVVLAAGSWSAAVEIAGASQRVPVRPIRGQLVYLGWIGTPLRTVTWSERCYVVPWADGTVLVGATVEDAGFDERTTVAGVRDLLEAASELLPEAWKATFIGARVGLRPGTSDDLPIVGASGVLQNLWYATGHYRNGILLAPLTARIVADAMLDRRNDPALEVLQPQRFGNL